MVRVSLRWRVTALAAIVLAFGVWGAAAARGRGGATVAATSTATLAATSTSTLAATEGQQFSAQVGTVTIYCAAAPASVTGGTIAWGDGSTSAASVSQPSATEVDVSGSHTYAEEGSYSGTVTVTWYCGSTPQTSSTTFSAQVADAALAASPVTVAATAGQQFSGTVATFTDADPAAAAGDYSASIDWGDGSTSSGTVTVAGGGFAINGSHTYAGSGDHTVTVTIADQGGAQAVAHSTAAVAQAAGGASFQLPPGPLTTGAQDLFVATGAGTVRSFRWALNGHPAAICDGSTSELRTSFLSPGSYTLALTVSTATGSQSSTQRTFTVTGAGVRLGVRPRNVRFVRTQQVFVCERGPSDPVKQIVPSSVLPSPGAGCQTQVQAGILDATGCLSEYQDQLTIYHSTYVYQGKSYQLADLGDLRQQLQGVPAVEARQLLVDLLPYFTKAPCESGIPCPQVQGATSYYGANPPPSDVPQALARSAGLRLVGSPRDYANTVLQTTCSQQPEPESGDTPSHACLDLWVSSGPVDINGVTYVPHNGAVVLVAPQFNLVISADAEQDIGNLRAQPDASVNYQLPASGQSAGTDFPALDASNLPALVSASPDPAAARQQFGSVAGFTTDAHSGVNASFSGLDSTTVTFQVDLPPPFTTDGGQPATVTVNATISDTEGLQVNYGYLGSVGGSGVSIDMGAVRLSGFGVCFRHQPSANDSDPSQPNYDPCPKVTGIPENASFGADFWDASGTVGIGSVQIVFRPGSGAISAGCAPVPLGIGFGGGRISFAGADLKTGGVPVAPGVTFDQLLASYADHPVDKLTGCVVFDAGDGLVKLVGNLALVFTNPQNPYTFSSNDLPDLQPPYPTTNDVGVGVDGSVLMDLPLLGTAELGGGYAVYVDDPAAVFFGATAKLSIPLGYSCQNPPDTGVALCGEINGAIGLASGFPTPFFLQGSMTVVAQAPLGNRLSGQLGGILSDDPRTGQGGVAVCGTASAEIFGVDIGTGTAGFGYHWGDDIKDVIENDVFTGGSCQDVFSSFAINVQAARAAAARTVRVATGAQAVDLYLYGGGGAPDVTISGPDRMHASTAGISLTHATRVGRVLLARMPLGNRTLIVLEHPPAGVYRIRLNHGSPTVDRLREATAFAPAIAAHVSGAGIHRVLIYRFSAHPGEHVSFIERSHQAERILGSARGGRGSIRFLAAAGHGRRQILAEVTVDRTPGTIIPVASYRAPGLARLGRVRALRVRRTASRAMIAFTPVAGARGYLVELTLKNGVRSQYLTRSHAITIGGIYPEIGGRVLVRAEGDRIYTADGSWTGGTVPAWLKPQRRARRHR